MGIMNILIRNLFTNVYLYDVLFAFIICLILLKYITYYYENIAYL